MNKSQMKMVAIVSLAICAVCVFIAAEYYQTNKAISQSLDSTQMGDHALYMLPIDIEGKEYASDVFMSVKERKISINDKAKYTMSKGVSGVDKASNAYEAFAANVVDCVYNKDKTSYNKLTKGRSGSERVKGESMSGYGLLVRAFDMADHVYFVSEIELLGMHLYESCIVPTTEAEEYFNEESNSFLLPLTETDSGIEHRFDALFEPVVQNLINARKYMKKEKQEVKNDLNGLVKVSYKSTFDDSISVTENVDYYFKVIKPDGDTLFFKERELVKADFSSEANEFWSSYAEIWSNLVAVPEDDGFQESIECDKFIDNFTEKSSAAIRKSLASAKGRHLANYKHMKLMYREVLFAIDAHPVYFVFYKTRDDHDTLGHDTLLFDGQGYKIANYSYLSDLEQLFDTPSFEQALFKMYSNAPK